MSSRRLHGPDMTLGISKKYALLFSAVSLFILFTVLVATGLVIWRSSEDLKERLKEGSIENFEAIQHATMYNLAEYLRSELFTPLYELDIERITLSLKDLRKGLPITSVRIADASGTVMTDGTRENPSYGMQLELDRQRLESSPVLIQHVPKGRRVTFRIGSKEYIAGYGEIIFSDAPLQMAIARQDESVSQIWRKYKQNLLKVALTWTAFIAFLTVFAGVLVSRTFSRPLIILRDATRKVAQGDLEHRVTIRSRDELGELAASFNWMVEDLQKRTAEIARTTEALQTEIEERKQTEAALRESEERRTMAERAGRVGGFEWDPVTGQTLFWSKQVELLFGFSPGEFQGTYQEWARHVHPDDLSPLEAQLHKLMQEHRTEVAVEYRFMRPDGEVRCMAVAAELLYAADGTASRIVGTIRDITDVKEYERELITAKEAAEAANLAKSEFLANMSHEMRTPLAGTLGMINLVLEMEIGAEERQLLGMAKRSAESLLRLISDLLDFSRLEAGILQFEHESFRVSEVVKTAIEVVSIQAREKELKLSWKIEESVPEHIYGDEGRLRQVLVNLVGNSVKFTEQGEVEVTVRPFHDPEAEGQRVLLFSIRDTGIGIATNQQEKIFGKFVQIDASSTRRFGGAGLGLALSKSIIEKMGGRIWFESSIGEGSVFFFTVPAP